MKSERPFHCPIAGTTVYVKWRAGGQLLEPGHSYVRCSERDCQYVDLNQPPCPLSVSMLEDGSSARIAAYLADHAGLRVCYGCVATTLSVTHEQVCRATWRLKDDADLTINVGRCVVCRRRRSTLMLPAQPGALVAPLVKPRVVERGEPDDGDDRVLAIAADATVCPACAAFAARLPLAHVHLVVRRLRQRGMLIVRDGVCETCHRREALLARAPGAAAANVDVCPLCDRPLRAGDNVIAAGGGTHLACWLDAQPPHTPDPGRLVAVVDDHDAAREAASKLLQDAGFRVVAAGTARGALDLLTTVSPDLYVLDLHLPDANGFKVCRAIKRLSRLTQVLSLSGVFCDDEHRRSAFEAGAAGFLTRPIDNGVLIRTVAAMVPVQ